MGDYSLKIRKEKPIFVAYTTDSTGLSPEIDLQGGTLDGILFTVDPTSTSLTIQVARKSGGTYETIKDGLGQYGVAGNAITVTIGTTGTGYFPISPLLTAGFRFCKIQLSSSEAADFYISKRNLD